MTSNHQQDYPEQRYVPLEVDPEIKHLADLTQPDWRKAQTMMENLGTVTPHIESWDEAIAVYLDDGTKLFAIHADGTVEAPDYERLPEAAVIFFQNVLEIAQLQGYEVRKTSEPKRDPSAEGWDA